MPQRPTHWWLGVAVACALVIAARARADDNSKSSYEDPFADQPDAKPGPNSLSNVTAKAPQTKSESGFDFADLPTGLISTDGHLGVDEVTEWSEFDQGMITACAVGAAIGSSSKQSADRWMSARDSLISKLRVYAKALPPEPRAEAKRIELVAIAAFRLSCEKGAQWVVGSYCSHVQLMGGVPVLSYVVGQNGWCELREGTKRDLQGWVRQARTEAERLKRTENLKTVDRCGRAAANKFAWDFVRPKRTD